MFHSWEMGGFTRRKMEQRYQGFVSFIQICDPPWASLLRAWKGGTVGSGEPHHKGNLSAHLCPC